MCEKSSDLDVQHSQDALDRLHLRLQKILHLCRDKECHLNDGPLDSRENGLGKPDCSAS